MKTLKPKFGDLNQIKLIQNEGKVIQMFEKYQNKEAERVDVDSEIVTFYTVSCPKCGNERQTNPDYEEDEEELFDDLTKKYEGENYCKECGVKLAL